MSNAAPASGESAEDAGGCAGGDAGGAAAEASRSGGGGDGGVGSGVAALASTVAGVSGGADGAGVEPPHAARKRAHARRFIRPNLSPHPRRPPSPLRASLSELTLSPRFPLQRP